MELKNLISSFHEKRANIWC